LMRTYSPALPALMQTSAGQYPASFGSTTGIHCVFSTSRHTAADYDIYYNKLSKNTEGLILQNWPVTPFKALSYLSLERR